MTIPPLRLCAFRTARCAVVVRMQLLLPFVAAAPPQTIAVAATAARDSIRVGAASRGTPAYVTGFQQGLIHLR